VVIKAFATRFAMSVIVHGHGRACSRKDYVVPDALKEGAPCIRWDALQCDGVGLASTFARFCLT